MNKQIRYLTIGIFCSLSVACIGSEDSITLWESEDGIEWNEEYDEGLEDSEDNIGVVKESLGSPASNCSDQRKDKIHHIADLAERAMQAGLDNRSIHLLKRWFGVDYHGYPLDVYDYAIQGDETINCGGDPCDDNPQASGVVRHTFFSGESLHLCESFWDKPLIGMARNSQVEILIHEAAHQYDVLGAQVHDYQHPVCTGWDDNECYGYPNSLRLASVCSDCAMHNAENYAGYAAEAFILRTMAAAVL